MDPLTLFSAYKKACFHRRQARERRQTTFGIRWETDKWARQYQRYSRLADKLNVRIQEKLGSEGAATYRKEACPICGRPKEICACGYEEELADE